MTQETKDWKKVFEEVGHYNKTKIPRCSTCKKNFKNGIDSVTGKMSEYIWVPQCEHNGSMKLCIG